jgi:signal transduction histidine kinase
MRAIHGELTRLSEDVHSLAYRLHPSLLDDLGLAEAIRVECEGFGTRANVAARFDAKDVPETVPPGIAIVLFRIAQEALRNVEKHSKASSVEVTLQGSDGGIQLVIHDDGVGFDRKRTLAKRSLGQSSMRERIRLVQGEIDIDSAPGEGTTILAWVPL